MTNTTRFPFWFSTLTFVYFLSNLFIFGGLSFFYPKIAFPDSGQSAVFPIQFFAIRHLAFAFPLLYGLVRKDIKVLLTCYSMFFVMTVLDVALLFIYGYDIPVIGELPFAAKIAFSIMGFIGPVVLSLVFLLGRLKEAGRPSPTRFQKSTQWPLPTSGEAQQSAL